MKHSVSFFPSGRGAAQCAPNPDFPAGVTLDLVEPGYRGDTCTVALPYPAPECGTLFVSCLGCMSTVACTAAGRADDPISIRLKCRIVH